MSAIEKVLTFITDNKKRLSSRATIIILSILLILITDNIIGFSEHYNKSNELQRLESISKLLNEERLSEHTKKKLIKLEKETLGRKNIVDHTIGFFKNIFWSQSGLEDDTRDLNGRSNIWFLISSAGLYILVAILAVPILLFTDRKTPILTLIATMLMFVLIMAFTSWFNYWLFDNIIPGKLFGSWVWNYIANFLLQVGLIFGYLAIDKYSKKQFN